MTRPLTDRQREVCTLFAHGLSLAEIGGRIGIAEMTARYHLHQAYARLGVDPSGSRRANRQAVAVAMGVAFVAPTRAVDESKRRPVPSKWPRTWMQV